VRALAFAPDGATLATGSTDRTVRLWNVRTGERRATLQGHRETVAAVAFHRDGHTLASGSKDGVVKLWDARTAQELTTLDGFTGSLHTLAFSPDGRTLAAGGASSTGEVCLWTAATEAEVEARWP
jgi:WD40 repeat protein